MLIRNKRVAPDFDIMRALKIKILGYVHSDSYSPLFVEWNSKVLKTA